MTGNPVVEFTFGGLPRGALLHVPTGYDPAKPIPLVVNLHGYSSNPIEQVALTGMNPIADARGFLVAYPRGVAMSWNAGQCCGDAWTGGVDDVGFIRALVARLEADYCIDARRVYATGMSNGGFMSYRLACEAPDVFAAVAPVAGVVGITADKCQPSRPVPVMHFHGTADPLVPYDGGVPLLKNGWIGALDFTSVLTSIAVFLDRDGCDFASDVMYQHGDATCKRWRTDCKQGSEVILCTIDGGGHTWPGGTPIPTGKTSTDISATTQMVDFFFAHPMP